MTNPKSSAAYARAQKPMLHLDNKLTVHQGSPKGRSCVLLRRTNRLHSGEYDFSLGFLDLSPEQVNFLPGRRDSMFLKQKLYPSSHLNLFPHPNEHSEFAGISSSIISSVAMPGARCTRACGIMTASLLR